MPEIKKPLRKKSVKIRLSDDEYETLMTKKTRLQLAAYIREKALLSADNVKVISVDPALIRAVGKIGNNLNQLTKFTNTKGEIHAQTANQIELMRIELKNLIETLKKDN